ncbi:MAG: hypothetical protein ACTHJG_01380 [Rhodanobacteraceae bacterium]
MDADADPTGKIPPALWRWCKTNSPAIPPPMFKARTFYEAMRASEQVRWQRKIGRFQALHTWATIALIGDPRTRPYMARIIHDEQSGFHWTIRCGCATNWAMQELERDRTRDRKRAFEQHRTATLKALTAAREHMAAMDCGLRLHDLLEGAESRKFRRVVERFSLEHTMQRGERMRLARERALKAGANSGEAFASAVEELLKFQGAKIPTLEDVLCAAEARLRRLPPLKPDRHTARAVYLRALFAALSDSPIASRRIAFLTHACDAVFGERIEKRAVRRLVEDFVANEKRRDADSTYSEDMHHVLFAEVADPQVVKRLGQHLRHAREQRFQ